MDQRNNPENEITSERYPVTKKINMTSREHHQELNNGIWGLGDGWHKYNLGCNLV